MRRRSRRAESVYHALERRLQRPLIVGPWTESTINWNNRPLAGGTVLASATVVGTAGVWYELDLTSFLQQQKAAGATSITLVLQAAAASNATVLFESDEAANRPELVIT
jgi:hypothetical protein